MATNLNKGKIVQMFNKEKYDSDIPTEQEYCVIDITLEPYLTLTQEINEGLKVYFKELEEIIKTSNFMYLSNVISKRIRPIAKYINDDDKITFCEENIKYKNLLRHLNKKQKI